MKQLINISLYFLMAVALGPLLLLGLYVAADRFRLSGAERILNILLSAFVMQAVTGALVNILGGLALFGLGIWGLSRPSDGLMKWGAALLLPFGLQRFYKGLALLKAVREMDEHYQPMPGGSSSSRDGTSEDIRR